MILTAAAVEDIADTAAVGIDSSRSFGSEVSSSFREDNHYCGLVVARVDRCCRCQ